jgi:hypothetical protein
MTNFADIPAALSDAAQALDARPLHQPHNWLHPDVKFNSNAHFANRALDISRGLAVIANVLRSDIIDRSSGVRALMSDGDTEALSGLSVAVLHMLSDLAEAQVEIFNAAASKANSQ